MLYKVTHCAGRILANTRPHQLRWGDQEMRTAMDKHTMNYISLEKKGLDVMQSHPLHRTHFNQYQASSAALG